MNTISGFVKLFLAILAFGAMSVGVAAIWGFTKADVAIQATGTLGLIGITVYLVDSVIYRKRNT
jgi:hypothetical protein